MNNFTSPISEVYWPNVSSENYFHYLQHLCTENRKTSWIYSLRQTPLITADCRTSMSLNCMGPLILRFFFFFWIVNTVVPHNPCLLQSADTELQIRAESPIWGPTVNSVQIFHCSGGQCLYTTPQYSRINCIASDK